MWRERGRGKRLASTVVDYGNWNRARYRLYDISLFYQITGAEEASNILQEYIFIFLQQEILHV